MNWEAANAPKVQVNPRPSDVGYDKRRSSETVEAALSRLSKAYTTSMECIGSLHKTNKMILKEQSIRQDAMAALSRVSNVARTTFETAILTDPLVLEHAPTLHRDFLQMERPKSIRKKRPYPPILSSAAHKATVRELTYLSLVNYSDLLQSCGSSHGSNKKETTLDRGVVRKLESLADTTCWIDESIEDYQRLALAALCDASAMDGSDPILWLKLACAARSLERTVHRRNNSVVLISKYRRIQRHALEKGATALPVTMPPNRAISRALKESAESPIRHYETAPLATTEEPPHELLELPRYSWSIFGRMLVRAWREGNDFRSKARPVARPFSQFGSPSLGLKLNPMFVLPPKLLGRICGFLDMKSVVQFECTCRFALISARASTITESEVRHPKVADNEMEDSLPTDKIDSTKDDCKDDANEKDGNETESKDIEKAQMQSHRTSKRLRSQMITSGKIAERSANRKSFEYCFLASTLTCTRTEYYRMLVEAKKSTLSVQPGRSSMKQENPSRNNSCDLDRIEAQERLSAASLGAFVERWNGKNCGPIDLLTKFLVHVAVNVQEVFVSDPRGPLELTSCILTAFDLSLQRSGTQQGIEPHFFKPIEKSGSIEKSLELFAVDLLHCELVLKQCEREVPKHVEFDDDSNMITLMVASLLEACSQLQCSVKDSGNIAPALRGKFVTLSIRSNWVAAGLLLWRSRISRVISDSREAEEEGIQFIDETIELFEPSFHSIRTPHLVSPGRNESHWVEVSPILLARFRDEIQASSVVSLAKQKFQEFIEEVDQNHIETSSGSLPTASAGILAGIGQRLFERYKSSHSDPDAKHIELVEDFLTVHDGDLQALLLPETWEGGEVEKRSVLVPIQAIELRAILQLTNPSILSILAICLNVSAGHGLQMAQLLVRLVLTTIDLCGSLLDRSMSNGGNGDEQYEENFSDSDDSVMSAEGSGYRHATNKGADEKGPQNCGCFVIFLLDRIYQVFADVLNDQEKMQFSTSDDCISMISRAISFSKSLSDGIGTRRPLGDDTTDIEILKALFRVVEALRTGSVKSHLQTIDRVCFVGLVELVTIHSPLLLASALAQGNRLGKAARQKLCLRSAGLLAVAFSELAYIFVQNLGKVKHLCMAESELMSVGAEVEGSTGFSVEDKNIFSDALLRLWKYASMALSEDARTSDRTAVCSSFDRPIIKLLQIPMASALVGFCGSATHTRCFTGVTQIHQSGDPLCLVEFFDSDASGNEWLADGEEDGVGRETKTQKKELLRAMCHAVHCINLVVDAVHDKWAISTFSKMQGRDKLGPLLPVVATRVLNHFADSLLLNFGHELNQREALWVDKYPYTTQTTGDLLDSLLRKSYSWLYGFCLVGEKAHQSAGKDSAFTLTTAPSDSGSKSFQPGGTVAAAQLYRCIVRAYAGGRRSLPKAALEVVSAALPPLEESEKSSILQDFMFNIQDARLGLDGVTKLIEKGEGWKLPFSKIASHIAPPRGPSEGKANESSFLEDEIMRVRRGISSELASGQVPMTYTDAGHRGKSDCPADDERLLSSKHEEEISKKFFAIVDDLCLGVATNTTGWYRAAQCLTAKAELIADRLGLTNGFARSSNFSVPTPRTLRKKKLPFVALLAEQELEEASLSKKWVQWIGNDLSVYARYLWSSFSSLEACSIEISQQEGDLDISGGDKEAATSIALREIDALYKSGDYVKWQEAWGGIFVCGLRKLALRFMCTALFILQSKNEPDADDKTMMSEVCEMIGVCLYSDLTASQNYGYPMHVMSQLRKRDVAIASKRSFQRAIDIVQGQGEDNASENRETWDLVFMVGKCDEKISGTYRHESYTVRTRQYEQHIASAIQHYSSALEQAKDIESDGGFVVGQQGGSSHGSTEVLYRMQASRLKCLISAVSQDENSMEAAEAEALRLTERNWFKEPEGNEVAIESTNTRDRVWLVFTDVVTGLAQCRLDHHFFHRSVYRHAQALMWAPLLCDPTSTDGSLGMVPALRSYTVRGLNNSTHAANSAEVVMSALFDKKRTQLCAVWMTTTATSSPFQILNNSSRKYDSLRGKYVAAYIESLRLCNRRTELEQFMKLLASSKRDLPNYFQTSAMVGVGAPPKSHVGESLLNVDESLMSLGFIISAKRQGNSALADLILKDLSDSNEGISKKTAEVNIRQAYACYLRLHCSEDDLKKTPAMKYGVASIREVEALCKAYLSTEYVNAARIESNDWSGGARKSSIFAAALETCRSQFPTVTGNFLFKNLSKSKEKGKEGTTAGSKRKKLAESSDSSGKSNNMSFEVSVPQNMTAGDTFLTVIKFGESSTKKVKLTVPEGNPSTLRFSLKVPPGEK